MEYLYSTVMLKTYLGKKKKADLKEKTYFEMLVFSLPPNLKLKSLQEKP